jgi:hypothetical protein
VIDAEISLASAIQSGRGRYALLLGSGVSRAAGIPSGWEVVLDLVQQIAEIEGADTAGDPETWYRDRFGHEPRYSELLAELARSQADRAALLRRYFEPSEEERAEGLKVPTAAHRAIAELVRDGWVSVIVTTNFDRLLETALEEAGVAPTVIASADAAKGALPLVHNACTVIKVHGDYRDARIRNTPEELAAYDPVFNQLLNRVFDEYGLVVCGWSGEYDTALGDAILKCETRRFQTFWAARGKLGDRARALLEHREAQLVKVADADAFFVGLVEKVVSLAELRSGGPASAKVAVATLKRYLPDESHRIRLHDLISDEVARVEDATSTERFPVGGAVVSHEALVERLQRYESACETLVGLMATLGYWASPDQQRLLTDTLERLVRSGDEDGAGLVAWLHLRRYPALLVFYATGLGAVARGDFGTLARILGDAEVRRHGDLTPLSSRLNPWEIVDSDLLNVPGGQRYYTPIQNRLHSVLREPLREFVREEERWEEVFDRFELLFAVVCAHLENGWFPPGRFGWRRYHGGGDVFEWARNQVDRQSEHWPFVRGRPFDQDIEAFRQALDAVSQRHVGWH